MGGVGCVACLAEALFCAGAAAALFLAEVPRFGQLGLQLLHAGLQLRDAINLARQGRGRRDPAAQRGPGQQQHVGRQMEGGGSGGGEEKKEAHPTVASGVGGSDTKRGSGADGVCCEGGKGSTSTFCFRSSPTTH